MKLQFKFTLNLIIIVLVTTSFSFFFINQSVQKQFRQFIQEKNQELLETTKKNPNNKNSPFVKILSNRIDKETPEDRFEKTVTNSLLMAAILAFLIALIIAHFQSKFLLQKIHQLKDSMKSYLEDRSSRPVIHGRSDEVDELAKIYNHLILKIEKEENIRKEFFIDLSHELRTPLTSIKGYLEGLIDKVFDQDKQTDIHHKALRETDRLTKLINELTNLAKLETEEPKLHRKNTNLLELTNEVIEMLHPEYSSKNLKTEVSGNINVNVDPEKFKQVIINLLENAYQYSSKDSVIKISMSEQGKSKIWEISNQSDLAIDIDPEKLFQRFFRNDKSRQQIKHKTNLGIGLNIVRKIIEQHQGTITAEKNNKKISFKIKLN